MHQPAAVIVSCAAALPAAAATIVLPGTGADEQGAVLSGGSADPHYTVTGPAASGGPAYVYSPANLWPDWVPNGASAWIGFSDNSDTRPYGTYTYTLTFDLSGYGDVSRAALSGRWAADQNGSIYLNGAYTGVSVADGNWYGPSHPQLNGFSIHGGFVAGINSLSFVVDEPDGFDGLRVEPTTLLTVVPEPAAAWLMALGLGPLGLAARRATRRCRRGGSAEPGGRRSTRSTVPAALATPACAGGA